MEVNNSEDKTTQGLGRDGEELDEHAISKGWH